MVRISIFAVHIANQNSKAILQNSLVKKHDTSWFFLKGKVQDLEPQLYFAFEIWKYSWYDWTPIIKFYYKKSPRWVNHFIRTNRWVCVMEKTRHTILLDADLVQKLRKIQSKLIEKNSTSVSFSSVINDTLRKSLNGKT